MNNIADYLKIKEPIKNTIRCERQELVGWFTDKINKDREGTKYKPLTCRFVAVKLGHLSVGDMRDFYKQCSKGEFSKIFFGALKVK